MKTETYYLVYVQIESEEGITDCHALYRKLEDAQVAMQKEIDECKQIFDSGETLTDLERCYEFSTEDDHGYTVGVEELILQ